MLSAYHEESAMNKKTEEMIALGVAYAINCTACMEYHKEEAMTAGLTEEEMLEAIKVAKQVKTGAAKKTEAVARELFGQSSEGQCCPPGNECCS
ncbi:MAG: carboxymuconolactone decarboxylase family protein [Planctomycetota bacterium]